LMSSKGHHTNQARYKSGIISRIPGADKLLTDYI
jgi:hypothetical protein